MGDHLNRHFAAAMDVAGIWVIAGSWFGYLPNVAAAFAILWYAVQVWESETGKKVRVWLLSKLR